MREREQIIELSQNQTPSVLITLVARRGSAYRREGAHLLIAASGKYAGTISGGCLEAELLTKAKWMVNEGATLRLYSSFFDDFSEMPYGLGCGGEVEVLLEPASTPEASAWLVAAANSLRGEASTVCTLLPEQSNKLARMVFTTEDKIVFSSSTLTDSSREKIMRACENTPSSRIVKIDQNRFFIERMTTPSRLLIFGAWDDAQPLCTLASSMGWHVEVADGRSHFVSTKRFPTANYLHVIASEHLPDTISLKPEDSVVLMTHSFQQDLNLLCAVVTVPLQYLGLLGASKRSAMLINLAAKRTGFSFQSLTQRIYAPAGLNIGAEGPYAIALSIFAQIEAVRNGIPQQKYLLSEGEEAILRPKC